jgi:hypothetical protein
MKPRLMRARFIGAMIAAVLTALVVAPGSWAAGLTDSYECQPITAANEVTPPPPLWEQEGMTAPPAQAERVAELPTATEVCPAGEIASPIPWKGPPPRVLGGQTTESGFDPLSSVPSALAGAADPQWSAPPEPRNLGFYYAGSGIAMKYLDEQPGGGFGEPSEALGASIEMAVGDPEVNHASYTGTGMSQAHSLGQLAMIGKGGTEVEATYTAEYGWIVDPESEVIAKDEPTEPHLFVFANHDHYNPAGEDKYNAHFKCIAVAPCPVGEPLTSFVTGPNNTIQFGLEYIDGNWWVSLGYEYIGYMEGSYWSTPSFESAPHHEYWGEVADYEGVAGGLETPTTDMGDGLGGANEKALLMRDPVLYPAHNQSEQEKLPAKEFLNEETPSLYNLGSINGNRTAWRYGGAGVGPVVPAPAAGPAGAATAGAESATVHGSVSPSGRATTYHFEYGKTAGYGRSTSTGSAGSGYPPVEVSAGLTGLASATTYHYRVVATNEAGTTYGPDETFQTSGPDVTPPVLTLSGSAVKAIEDGATSGTYELHIAAADGPAPQSGVAKIELSIDGTGLQSWEKYCPAGGCSLEVEWPYSPASFSGAGHVVTVSVRDHAGNVTEETISREGIKELAGEAAPTGPDMTPPVLGLTGSAVKAIEEGATSGTYELHIAAADGSQAAPQSGVAKIEVAVDGATQRAWEKYCPVGSCGAELAWSYMPASFSGTGHVVKVTIRDHAGNVTERTISP